jgi:hypothetical protein
VGFNSTSPKSAMGRSDRLEDLFGEYFFDYNDAVKEQELRPIGPVIAYEYYWFDIITEKGKSVRIPRLCIDLDPYTDTYTSENCPFRASGLGGQGRFYLVNAIWRKQQDAKPAKLPKKNEFESKLRKVMPKTPDFPQGWEAYQLSPGSSSWTPVYVLKLSANSAASVVDMIGENTYKGKTYDATHEDHGFDLLLKYNPKGTGTGKFQLNKGEQNALDDEEMDYLVHKLDVLKFPSPKEAEADWKKLKPMIDSDAKDTREDKHRGKTSASRLDDDDEGDEDEAPRKGKSRVKDEEDDRPVRRKGPAGRSRKSDDDDLPF